MILVKSLLGVILFAMSLILDTVYDFLINGCYSQAMLPHLGWKELIIPTEDDDVPD